MSKDKISDYSSTANSNTDIAAINIDEGCAPSGINNAIRALMAQLKNFQTGASGDSFNGPVGSTTPASVAATTLTTSSTVTHNGGTANGVAYLNGSKVLTTGSALQFDGANLGLGVTPSAWYSTLKAIDNNTIGGWACNTNTVNFLNNGYLNAAGNWTYKTTEAATNYEQWNGHHAWYTAPSGTAGNAISWTQAMKLDASGRWLLGGPVADNSAFAEIFYNGLTYNGFVTKDSSSSGTTYSNVFVKNGSVVGNISQTTTATAYNTSSDYRLKDITGPITGAEAKAFVMALQPKQGSWKADGSPFAGFVAHEFQEVSPSSVSGTKDAVDAEGKPVMQSMQASSPESMANIVALLQLLVTENEQLKADVAALKAA